MTLANSGEPLDVGHLQERVGERLNEECARVRADRPLNQGGVARVYVAEGEAELLEDFFKKPVTAAVEVFGDNQVVSLTE